MPEPERLIGARDHFVDRRLLGVGNAHVEVTGQKHRLNVAVPDRVEMDPAPASGKLHHQLVLAAAIDRPLVGDRQGFHLVERVVDKALFEGLLKPRHLQRPPVSATSSFSSKGMDPALFSQMWGIEQSCLPDVGCQLRDSPTRAGAALSQQLFALCCGQPGLVRGRSVGAVLTFRPDFLEAFFAGASSPGPSWPKTVLAEAVLAEAVLAEAAWPGPAEASAARAASRAARRAAMASCSSRALTAMARTASNSSRVTRSIWARNTLELLAQPGLDLLAHSLRPRPSRPRRPVPDPLTGGFGFALTSGSFRAADCALLT